MCSELGPDRQGIHTCVGDEEWCERQCEANLVRIIRMYSLGGREGVKEVEYVKRLC